MANKNIKILVVDDHKIVRDSIAAILNREPDMEVVGTARDGLEAIKSAESLYPDVIVMDVSMPVLDGIRATAEIKALANPAEIIMLSMHHDNVLVQEAWKIGVAGYVAKQNAALELIPTIRAVYKTSFLNK